MLSYYKFRTEITNEFGVSEGAVRNWIKKALAGEIDLELTEVNGKKLILKNQKNYNLINALAQEGKKYKSLEDREIVLVDEAAYSHLDKNQVIGILGSLESNKSIPHKYFYLNGGADYWENFYEVSLKDSQYTTSHSDLYYFDNCYHLIKDNFHKFEKINIVDIGQGNGEPALGLLKKLDKEGILNSYTAIDISPNMLEHAKKHICKALPSLKTNFVVLDFENKSLSDVLHSIRHSGAKHPILILGLGGTLFNRINNLHTFFNIIDSMQKDDLVCVTNAFVENERSNYNFTIKSIPEMYKLHTWLARKFGLSEELTDVELRFNEKTGFRELNLVLKKDLELVFKNPEYTINLYKHDRVNIWLHKKDTFSSISKLAEELSMKLKMIVKHPVYENVMYMMGKS